jgi:hypothetical protein
MLSVSSVKWLGKDTISALAMDGKGTKADMLQKVAQWVAASGRNISQPGQFTCAVLFGVSLLRQGTSSHDCVV